MNIIDNHRECFRHRVCNSAFPCALCKDWTAEKRQAVEKMIEKKMKRTACATVVSETHAVQEETTESPFTGNNINVPPDSPFTGNIQSSQNPFIGSIQPATANTCFQNPNQMFLNPMMLNNELMNIIDQRVQDALRQNNSTVTTATVCNERPVCSVSEGPISTPSQNRRRYNRLEAYDHSEDNNSDEHDAISVQVHEEDSDDDVSHASLNTSISQQNASSVSCSTRDENNNKQESLSFIKFMMTVADTLNISREEPRMHEDETFTSYVPEHVSNKSKSESIRVRLPLDGMVLEALDSVDKEFQAKGILKAFKAKDDEKFQVSNKHYEKYCSTPKLDKNVEEGLANSSFSSANRRRKSSSSKKSNFRFKDQNLFAHNNEIKRVDVQARLLLRAVSYGTLITSYLGKLPEGADTTEGLQALFQVFTGMADIASRLTVNAVNSRRNLHLQEMSFRNESRGKTRNSFYSGTKVVWWQIF